MGVLFLIQCLADSDLAPVIATVYKVNNAFSLDIKKSNFDNRLLFIVDKSYWNSNNVEQLTANIVKATVVGGYVIVYAVKMI